MGFANNKTLTTGCIAHTFTVADSGVMYDEHSYTYCSFIKAIPKVTFIWAVDKFPLAKIVCSRAIPIKRERM